MSSGRGEMQTVDGGLFIRLDVGLAIILALTTLIFLLIVRD